MTKKAKGFFPNDTILIKIAVKKITIQINNSALYAL